jgi:hypothetical protein
MTGNKILTTMKRLAGVAAFCVSSAAAFAQSCPLCINNVAASKPSFIAGLRHGILILLFPPLAICLSIGMMSYQRRNQFNEDDPGVNDL